MTGADDQKQDANMLMDRIVEVNKARLSLNLFLALAMITVTGFAVREEEPRLFLVAACIPIYTFIIDLLLRIRFLAPFLYKLLSIQDTSEQKEDLGYLYVAFCSPQWNGYSTIFEQPPGTARQLEFRRKYLRQKLAFRATFYATGSLAEVLLYLLIA